MCWGLGGLGCLARLRCLGRHAEGKSAQGRPIFGELHPSGTIGRVSGGFRFAHALLRPLLAFADAFHNQPPLAATTSTRVRIGARLRKSTQAITFRCYA
jgi:hypothetical protein